MLANFDAWRDALLPQLPGAYEAAVRSAFNHAAHEFYMRSRSWREVIELTPDQTGQVFLAPISQYADMAFLEACWVKDPTPGQNKPLPRYVLNGPGEALQWQASGGIGRVTMVNPTTLQVDPPEGVADTLAIEVSLMTQHSTGKVPAFAVTHHFSALEAGTLARMMLQPSKPFTSTEAAAFYARRFNANIVRAIDAQQSGFGGRRSAHIPVVASR